MDAVAKASPLYAKYGTRVEAESAREKLAARMEQATVADEAEPAKDKPRKRPPKKAAPAPSGGVDAIGDFLGSRQGKAMQKKVMRGVFGMLKKRL